LQIALVDGVSEDEDLREIWDALHQDLTARAAETSGARFLDSLEQDLSHFLQIEGPSQANPDNRSRADDCDVVSEPCLA
jgi:hypothetical protein